LSYDHHFLRLGKTGETPASERCEVEENTAESENRKQKNKTVFLRRPPYCVAVYFLRSVAKSECGARRLCEGIFRRFSESPAILQGGSAAPRTIFQTRSSAASRFCCDAHPQIARGAHDPPLVQSNPSSSV